ncbi:MAG: MBL fold metallo-hydrolase [Bradymonadales bacterium]|nr:MAG: MBL fold metallo-hydrolase [Bradymonadales bacterium]
MPGDKGKKGKMMPNENALRNQRIERGEALLRFWGVRGSLSSNASLVGSHTSCVELEFSEGISFIFDAGSGIRDAGVDREFKRITLFISHFHWDHIQGLPFFPTLIYSDTPIEIISCFEDTHQRLATLFDPRFHPVPLENYLNKIKISLLKEGETIEREGLKIQCARLNHPGDSFAFRVESPRLSFVYATDSDYDPLPDPAKEVFQGADIAVVDSQYLVGDSLKKAGYGHSSFKRALDVCAEHQVRSTYLFHFDPSYSDEKLEDLERQAIDYVQKAYETSGPKVQLAREGRDQKIHF